MAHAVEAAAKGLVGLRCAVPGSRRGTSVFRQKNFMTWRLKIRRLAERALRLGRFEKSLIVFAADALLCVIATYLAFSLRVGALDFPIEQPLIFSVIAIPAFILSFYFTNAYSTIFRFVGGRSIAQLAKGCAIYALPLIVLFTIRSVPGIPRTVALIQPMIFFGLVVSSRVFLRYLVSDVILKRDIASHISRVLIYGAGRSGQQLAASLQHEQATMVVGFIDDDERLRGNRLDGIPIHHASDLRRLAERQTIDTVLLALPRTSRQRRSEIVEELRPLALRVQTLPAMSEIFDGQVSISDLRDVQIEDLLGRDEVRPNELLLARTIVDRTIMVTGAGGSIGSELCRQIAVNKADRIILFEMSEFNLYQIERELSDLARSMDNPPHIVPVLGSVTDAERVAEIFDRWRPHTVFHAAAYKHVPLVEENPGEGIRNNIVGTRIVAEQAARSGTADFTLISTDKAVRPTNVMGGSKRAAEMIVQALAAQSPRTRFSMVRFGNVLGSSGSVVPLFRQQIEAGGPVTLTHSGVTRYFMTIPEAAQLVIQAGGMARGGEVFVLDMGEPVRIVDLARSMIELSGLSVKSADNPAGDIEIVEVGLRPGEKLYEELLIGESPEPTKHPRIMKAHETYLPIEQSGPLVDQLAAESDRDKAIALLKQLVPEFEHRRDNDDKPEARSAT